MLQALDADHGHLRLPQALILARKLGVHQRTGFGSFGAALRGRPRLRLAGSSDTDADGDVAAKASASTGADAFVGRRGRGSRGRQSLLRNGPRLAFQRQRLTVRDLGVRQARLQRLGG